MVVVDIKDKRFEKPISYYMDNRLKANFDNKIKPDLKKNDKDCFIAVDGSEGAGKSTLALQIGKYVDPTLNLDRVCFDSEDFRKKVLHAKKGQAVVFDEAFVGLSSRASLSKVNTALVSMMMQARQKNLFVIIVLPTFFLLDKYVAIWRTRSLIHVYESGGRRGYFKVYNRKKKKLLYLKGKQTYSYLTSGKNKVETSFRGRFYGKFALGGEKEEEKYRKIKEDALRQSESNPMTAGQVKYRDQRDILLYLLRRNTKMTYKELENLLGDYDLSMTYVQIRNICAKYGDKEKEEEKKEEVKEKEEKPQVNGGQEEMEKAIKKEILSQKIQQEAKEEKEEESEEGEDEENEE